LVRLAVALVVLVLVPAALAAYGAPKRVGTITAPALSEVSGLTAASVVPNAWWVVNDSGNPAQLHLIGGSGRLIGSVSVRGAANVDWEDLASSPGPGGRPFLYVGDIGDNGRVRDDLAVYRIREPSPNARSVRAAAFPFRYPDRRHNAEALFVDPASGRIYVVTKSEAPAIEPCGLYRFPLPLRPGKRVTLERLSNRLARDLAPVALVTGAALSPDGTRLAIRTYVGAAEWRRAAATPFERIFAARPERVSLASEPQGEAIAYERGGGAIVTTSEQLPAPLWRLQPAG
jgi:hypothetical protein